MLIERVNNIEQLLRNVLLRPNTNIIYVFRNQATYIKNELSDISNEIQHDYPSLYVRLKNYISSLFKVNPYGIYTNSYVCVQVIEVLGILGENLRECDVNIWVNIHPLIIKSSQKLYIDGHYTNAAQDAFVEINDRLKSIYAITDTSTKTPDGTDLMHKIFSGNNPKLSICDLNTESGKNIQLGLEFMAAGAISALRNPKAHSNKIIINKEESLRRLMFASMLMYMIDEAVEYSNIIEN